MRGMRGAIIVGVLAAGLTGGAAAAHHDGHEFQTSEQCMQSGSLMGSGLPSCTRTGDGPWVAEYGGQFGGSQGPGSGWFAAFVTFAILWSMIPAVASGMVASSRGQSVGLAVLVGIVLGWIGLLIVVLAFKPEVSRAARNVVDAAAEGRPLRAQPSASAASTPQRDLASRLRELSQLRDQGLISDTEYAEWREQILNTV